MLATRRRSDAQVPVIHLQANQEQRPLPIQLRRVESDRDCGGMRTEFLAREIALSELPGEALVIIEIGDGIALSIDAAEIRTLSVTGARERFEGAVTAAAVQGERRHRERERFRRASTWMLLVEHLNRTADRQEVFDVLAERVVELVEAHAALFYARQGSDANDRLRAIVPSRLAPDLPASLLDVPFPLQLLRTECEKAVSGPRAALWPLFPKLGAASLALNRVGSETLLVLVERRGGRLFNGEDWFILRNVAAHAAMALDRIAYQQGRVSRCIPEA